MSSCRSTVVIGNLAIIGRRTGDGDAGTRNIISSYAPGEDTTGRAVKHADRPRTAGGGITIGKVQGRFCDIAVGYLAIRRADAIQASVCAVIISTHAPGQRAGCKSIHKLHRPGTARRVITIGKIQSAFGGISVGYFTICGRKAI